MAPVGLGACVRAVDLQSRESPVVIKFLPALDEGDLERVDVVAQSLEPLRHSAIVPVLGHGLDGARPFFVVAPPEGKSLRAYLDDRHDALAWPELAEVRAIIDGACAAVGVAHRMRAVAGDAVLHGMLSPDSVWVSRASDSTPWDVTVMDFALASLPGVTWTSEATSLVGDPRAPEQLVDPAAISCAGDVFALGVLLATILVPFSMPIRPRCWAHFVAHDGGDVRAVLQSMRADLPTPLCDEIARALSRSPDDRHADADRLRTALRRVTWEPARELKPPPRAVRVAPVQAQVEGSSPLIRLPSALMADRDAAPMSFRRATSAAPAAPVDEEHTAAESRLPFDVMSEPASTIPTPSAIDALKAVRHAQRAKEPTAAVRAPSVADAATYGATEFVRVPDGDLFAGGDWAADAEPVVVAPPQTGSTVPLGSLRDLVHDDDDSEPDEDQTHVSPRPAEVARAAVAIEPAPRPLSWAPPPPSPWRATDAPVVTPPRDVAANSLPHPGQHTPTHSPGALHSPVVLGAVIVALASLAAFMLWMLLHP